MGWTIYPHTPRDPKAEIARLCTWETDIYTAEVIHHVIRGSTHFVAIKKTPKPGEAMIVPDFQLADDGSFIFAAVFLTRKDRDGSWGYKDMDETMGPYVRPPSKKFVAQLSPTTSDYANNWRAKANIKTLRPKIGDVVRLHKPWEPHGDTFTKIEYYGKRGVYRSNLNGNVVRLRTSEIAEIIT